MNDNEFSGGKWLHVYGGRYSLLERFTNEELGIIFRLLLKFGDEGEVPQEIMIVNHIIEIAFVLLKGDHDFYEETEDMYEH